MARAEVPGSLYEVSNQSASLKQQVAALKQLKHDIIGHDQRKELVVCHGLVRELVRKLGGIGKRRSNGHRLEQGEQHQQDEQEQEEDEVRVQSIQIVTSLAHGTLHVVALSESGKRKVATLNRIDVLQPVFPLYTLL
jgi:hypothetical protein